MAVVGDAKGWNMAEWSAGYVADIGYTYGYYAELNPLRAKFALLNARLAVPQFEAACELGFGQGVSANLHAAASSVKWHGTDFNPSQAAFAQELAKAAGSQTYLYDESFLDFASRDDLPEFDFISMHGIWSWISDENRSVVVEFLRKKLKVGGVLYVSYNTYPGWAAFAPLRHIMTEHASALGAEGRGVVARVDGAVEFAEKLLATNPLFLRANPNMRERIEKIKGQNRHYLAHEYFNRDWQPMHFATMADLLEPAKLQYACSAHYLDHIDTFNFTPSQASFLAEIPDPMLRESVRDFMVNQQFRRDYWIRGARRISIVEQIEQLRQFRLILVANPSDISLKIKVGIGEFVLSEAIYSPVLAILSDHKPKTVDQIEKLLKPTDMNFTQLLQALLVLMGQGWVMPAQEDATIAKVRKQCDRVNSHIIAKARGSSDIAHLASPVTGGGIAVTRSSQLFLLARQMGRVDSVGLADFTLQNMLSQGQSLVRDGRPLEATEFLSELTSQAQVFVEKQLPMLKALQIT